MAYSQHLSSLSIHIKFISMFHGDSHFPTPAKSGAQSGLCGCSRQQENCLLNATFQQEESPANATTMGTTVLWMYILTVRWSTGSENNLLQCRRDGFANKEKALWGKLGEAVWWNYPQRHTNYSHLLEHETSQALPEICWGKGQEVWSCDLSYTVSRSRVNESNFHTRSHN